MRPEAIAPLRSTAISHEVTNTLSRQRFDDHAVGCCGPRDVQHVLDRIEDGQCRSIPFLQALTGSALDAFGSIPLLAI